MTLPGFISDDIIYLSQPEEGTGENIEEGAGDPSPTNVLRDLGAVVELYHQVICWSSSSILSFMVGGVYRILLF